MKNVVIWGASGHAEVVADIVESEGRMRVVAFVDDVTPRPPRSTVLALPVLQSITEVERLLASGTTLALVAIGECAARMRVAERAVSMGFTLERAVHPRATVSRYASIGSGTVVAAGVVVNAGVRVGDNVIINTAASVDHHCVLEDGVHIAPGAHLAGNVLVGRGAWVGIGASVLERRKIGAGALIGGGAVVVHDIPETAVAFGNPARVQRRKP